MEDVDASDIGEDGVPRDPIKKEAHIAGLHTENKGPKTNGVNVAEKNREIKGNKRALEERVQKLLAMVDIDGCTEEEVQHVRALLEEFPGSFGMEGEPLSTANVISHKINLTTDKPIRQRMYRFPVALKEQLMTEVNKMIEQGILEPSTSPYCSNVWIVPKKADANGNKRWRVVTDFRALNAITVGSCFPLPNTSDMIEQLARANYITAMDLKSGFHQIPMDPESAQYTAISVPVGEGGGQHLQYRKMAMGLKEATQTFSRAMVLTLAGLIGIEVLVYIDDLMIFAETLEEHDRRFRNVMRKLEEANFTVEPKKCQFLKRKATVLGHIVGNGTIQADPGKLRAIQKYPAPTSAKKVKQWLGLIGYYRRFIKDFAKIAEPIGKFLRKGNPFAWENEQKEAFEKLKEILCKDVVLSAPDPNQPFVVTTDASDYALGAVLSQGEIGKDRPCAFASRALKGAELRYSTYDKELLAVVFARDQFRHYLYGKKFTVVTDHQPLKHFHNTQKPDHRFSRLKAELHGEEFDVIYKPGAANVNADALSRNPVLEEGEENPERCRAELYKLAERQERADAIRTQEEAAIQVTRAIRNRENQNKEKAERSDTDEIELWHDLDAKKGRKEESTTDESELSTTDSDNNSSDSWRPLARRNPWRIKGRRPRKCCSADDDALSECEVIINNERPQGSDILSQAQTNEKLGYLRNKNMENGIKATSTPVNPTATRQRSARNPIRPQSLNRQPQRYDRTPDDPESTGTEEEDIEMPLQVQLSEGTEPIELNPTHSPGKETRNTLGDTLAQLTNRILTPPQGKTKADIRVRVRERERRNKKMTRIDVWETQADTTSSSDGEAEQPKNTSAGNVPRDYYRIMPSTSEADGYGDDDQCGLGHTPIQEIAEKSQDQEFPSLPPTDTDERDDDMGQGEKSTNSPTRQRPQTPPNDRLRFCERGGEDECAEPGLQLTRSQNIPKSPPGNCLFYSLMKLCRMDMSTRELRSQLLRSRHLDTNDYPEETIRILESNNMYGDDGCVSLFAKEFGINICVHLQADRRIIYQHFKVVESQYYIHLHLRHVHYTPLLRLEQRLSGEDDDNDKPQEGNRGNERPEADNTNAPGQINGGNSQMSEGNDSPNDSIGMNENGSIRNSQNDAGSAQQRRNAGTTQGPMHKLPGGNTDKYITANARPPREKPPWALGEGEQPPPFNKIEAVELHPFRYEENLLFLRAADSDLQTEVQKALAERGYLQGTRDGNLEVGEINILEVKQIQVLEVAVKQHLDDRPLKSDIKRCIRVLKNLVAARGIRTVAIIRDLEILTRQEWQVFIDLLNQSLMGKAIRIILLLNNLRVPPTESRYKLIKEYHEGAVGGHKGIHKTYEKIANDYYWKNLRADVKQFVLGCPYP